MNSGSFSSQPWRWVALAVILSAGGFFLARNNTTSNSEDGVGMALIKTKILPGFCERFDDIKILDRVVGTASANNRPAYVIGYSFNCVSNLGNTQQTLYVGWLVNKDTNQYQCIHWNANRQTVLNDGWWGCGGNFKMK